MVYAQLTKAAERIFHVNAALHLLHQQRRDAVGISLFTAKAVEQHRHLHLAKGLRRKTLCQCIPGGGHEAGVERAAHLERDAAAGTGFFGQCGGFVHSGFLAADDQLTRAVVVADLHTAQLCSLLTAGCKCLPVKVQHGGHAAVNALCSFGHGFAAVSGQLDGLLCGEHPGSFQRGVFAQRKPGSVSGLHAMLGQHGEHKDVARPSDAVEILGLNSVPAAGDEFRVFEDPRDARNLAEQRSLKARIEEQNKVKHVTLETLFDEMSKNELKELNLVVKADAQGTIEALADSISKMDQSEVRINIIHSAVGAISETDVTLAMASNAIIIGFGVRPQPKARDAAERENVQIKTYSIIYKAIEDIDAARIGMLKPTEEEVQTGSAEVRDTFRVPKAGLIAGCMVTEGEISRDDKVRVVRDGVVVFDGVFGSMRRFKDDVKTVKSGYECGLGIEKFQDIKVGDILEAYKIVEVARTE